MPHLMTAAVGLPARPRGHGNGHPGWYGSGSGGGERVVAELGQDVAGLADELACLRQGGDLRMIFVNSMSDLFHKEIRKSHISKVFDTMEKADWHIYQVLTKRSSLLRKFLNERYQTRKAPPHMWFGVSVENDKVVSRIAHLQDANVSIRFLSIEPLIGPVGRLNLEGIDWVIVGGESGPGARPIDPRWAINIRNQCVKSKVAFFFKQWGGRTPKAGGRLLEGREWNQFPMELPRSSQRYDQMMARDGSFRI